MPLMDAPFFNAYTFGFCEKRGFTQKTGWRRSMELMAASTGCDAIILPVCAWQDHPWSTEMDSDGPDVMSAQDAAAVCDQARALGLRVILKAMVNCRDGAWRAFIHFFEPPVPNEPSWEQWFASWTRHVCFVADIARENNADMLCVGCEMVGADGQDARWRELIRQARLRYGGLISYNCDKYQEDRLTWWDAVDVMSSSGYYPIDALDENLERIRRAAVRAGRPFMFMECGCPSRGGSQYRPNDWRFGNGLDLEAQRAWYEAFTQALLRHPFVRGTGWWDWPASRLYPEYAGLDNDGYCTWGKPANAVLARFAESLQQAQGARPHSLL